MTLKRIPAVFMRGGTSKAIVFHASDLPPGRDEQSAIFLQAMGTPDPNGRQLDGMGGGVSSLSKICVVGPPSRDDADVDFTFAQVGVRDRIVDFAGNCGNMSAAIGPFAIEEGLIKGPADGEACVRIHNTNTGKIIVSRFPVADGALAADGALEIDGVAGTAAPIRLEFLEPGGAATGRLLPTGAPVDMLRLPDGSTVRASCVDAANPFVFVEASELGATGAESPEALERNAPLLATLEDIRRAASVKMGLTATFDEAARKASVPKVAIVCGPRSGATLSGAVIGPEDADVWVRMISMGQPHRATPITGAIGLAVAARIPGSVPATVARPNADAIRIAHPSGVTVVDARVETSPSGELVARHGAIYRTARRLFEGRVVYRD